MTAHAAAQEPCRNPRTVVPNDSTDLPDGEAYSLWIGGAGNLTVISPNGQTIGPIAVPVGLFPFRVTRVKVSTGPATPIIAMYHK
jgi:hypothetical protein